MLQRDLELWRRDVVRGREPTVGESRRATEPRVRAPTADPDRWTRRVDRTRLEVETFGRVEAAGERRRIGLEQRAQRLDRLVEARPSLVEVDADRGVVQRRRSGPDGA